MNMFGEQTVFKTFIVDTPSVVWILILVFIMVVLPWLLGKYMIYNKFISYLKENRKGVYDRLVESSSFRAMAMFSRDFLGYINSPTDTEDTFIADMKSKSLKFVRYYKYMVVGLVILGVLVFSIAMVFGMLSGIEHISNP